ncbi:glutaredoxin family protein [Neptunicella sp. SCSIO 80796]|uniref:glutaredoxin family protein n=1 Tax=Neptunicella plasticusilytica TaxID=3117012 RepID=UPI003A4D9D5D
MVVVRWLLGRLILFFDWLFTPKSVKRSEAEQARIDRQTRQLSLYQFKACPFCVKVRRAMKRYGLNIETCDAKGHISYRNELLTEGGKLKVPCLRIEEGESIRWMYESSDIIQYLEQRFAK